MSEDKRELILARLYAILEGIKNFTTVSRNVDEIHELKRPCAVLIDGDETRSPDAKGREFQPVMMIMTPIIGIGTGSTPDGLGPAVSALRARVISAVLADATLQTILSTNGRIYYDGLSYKLSHGSLMQADNEIRFAIHYPLKPADL